LGISRGQSQQYYVVAGETTIFVQRFDLGNNKSSKKTIKLNGQGKIFDLTLTQMISSLSERLGTWINLGKR